MKKQFFIIISISLLISNITICGSVSSKGVSDYSTIYKRNVFRPLWKTYNENKDNKSRQEELEALRRSEEERKLALQQSEEQRKLEAKKSEIENNYSLTGIIIDNNKAQAVIQEKNGTSHFVYQDDMINDIKVTSVDESKGEVVLDNNGLFSVTLKMK